MWPPVAHLSPPNEEIVFILPFDCAAHKRLLFADIGKSLFKAHVGKSMDIVAKALGFIS